MSRSFLFCMVLRLAAEPSACSVQQDGSIEECASGSGTCTDRGKSLIQLTSPSVTQVTLQTGRPLDDRDARQTPSLSQLRSSGELVVVSYNLYWWNVRQNSRWTLLWNRINGEKPFDLIGFQECEDVAYVVEKSNLVGYDHYQGPKPNPAPLAWNTQVFTKIGGPGHKWIAKDRWGDRHLTWVRLLHKQTGAKIFFANTHGPLDNCGSTVGNNWVAGVKENQQAGDIAFMTGDFNCWTGTPAINALRGVLGNGVDGGIDMILTDRGTQLSGGKREGAPSDHPLIKAAFRVSGNGGASNPAVSDDCQDNNGQCAPWAQAGECTRNPAYMSTNCKKSCRQCQSTSGTAPATNSCDVASWPDKDHDLVCGDCKVLVDKFNSVYRTCNNYCAGIGRQCVGAWEEQNDDCNVKSVLRCDQTYASSDAICQCGASVSATSGPTTRAPAATTTQPPRSEKPSAACDEGSWPDKDHNLICGKCKVLVDKFSSVYRTCNGYCGKIGRQCVAAWEESDDTCNVKHAMTCDQALDSSDAICQCTETAISTPAGSQGLCYGALSNVAMEEGNGVGQKVQASSAEKCQKSCDGDANCQSFTLCPGWNACWMKDRSFSGSERTKTNADCKTYYKKACDGAGGSVPVVDPSPKPVLTGSWTGSNMKMTHYWDCSGQGCDASTLQPWNRGKFISPPGYGPQDPLDFAGGAQYGESMWLTGAASDALSQLMGDDDGCCGKDLNDGGVGGCGKCVLIQNPSSLHPDWTAVVMKKNRCPPNSAGCAAGEPHFDVAAPGFDNLQYSTANICGNLGTGFSNKQQSEAVGKWSTQCRNTADCSHLCDGLPFEFRRGCKLFASWGWTRGDPTGVKYRSVPCPAEFVKHVSSQFGANGVA